MTSPSPLQADCIYHIFNRGINGQNLFLEDRNYRHFLKLYTHHIEPVADTYAYCLLPNHFHLLVRVETEAEQRAYHDETLKVSEIFRVSSASQGFGNLFNAYTKAMNQAYQRTGSLFEHPFHRLLVTTDAYFTQLVVYIHQNPQRHGLIDDFRRWPYSSYGALRADAPTRLKRDTVLARFGGIDALAAAHHHDEVDHRLKAALADDFR